MKNLSNLLERISKVLNKNEALKEAAINLIREKTKVSLSPDQIFIKDGVLEISASQAAKNEIKLKEDSLKTELKVSRIFYK